MKQNLSKRLGLKKNTIANLNSIQLNKVIAGGVPRTEQYSNCDLCETAGGPSCEGTIELSVCADSICICGVGGCGDIG